MPQLQITMNMGSLRHNMTLDAHPQYSGQFFVAAQQWGAFAVNTDNASWGVNGGMVSPVVGPGPGFQPPAACRCQGDFHQSAAFVAASPNTPKWVVSGITSLGSHFGCTPTLAQLLQVYSLDTTHGLRFVSQYFIPNGAPLAAVIWDDVAYIELTDGTWWKVNLAALVSGVTQDGPCPAPVGYPTQSDIDGCTYQIVPGVAPPPPANATFILNRQGTPVDELPFYCPRDYVNRQQMAAIVWKAAKSMIDNPPAGDNPPPATGAVFKDVPAGNPFAPYIEDLYRRGVVAGKPACDFPVA